MSWFFRVTTIVVTLSVATLVSLGLASIVFHGLSGFGFVRLLFTILPMLIGLYASIHIIATCLIDDRETRPSRSQAD